MGNFVPLCRAQSSRTGQRPLLLLCPWAYYCPIASPKRFAVEGDSSSLGLWFPPFLALPLFFPHP